ncbi:MAG: ABC transporter permease [Acidobacteria bacterium]|nr:MAG: ABC transporter permease [Acidobacteriota bacterium]
MFKNLLTLFRYRVLIQSLVERELKARYRGSVLGFLWSFINPLLQLAIYWFVFSYIMPTRGSMGMSPYALFLFTGILPWTWFSSSVMESSAILISSGNLIKKILFPAEVLPIVVVLSNLVHFFLGLPILFAFLIYYGKVQTTLVYFPAIVVLQLFLTLGICFFVSALAVHFRDVQNIIGNLMMLWFFASPVIYSYLTIAPSIQRYLNYNPMTHILVGYQQILFTGEMGHWPWLLIMIPASLVTFLVGYYFFDRLRETFAEEV